MGDVDPSEVEKTIQEKFGHLTAENQALGIKIEELKPEASKLADALVGRKDVVKSNQSWHYPPVKHDWSVGSNKEYISKFSENDGDESDKYDLHLQDTYQLDDKVEFLKTNQINSKNNIRPHIFRYVYFLLSEQSKFCQLYILERVG